MSMVEVRVPDLGDAKGVNVVDVLVKKGSEIRVEDPLITLETEKASMDVPSPVSGMVDSMEIKKGDEVSAGALIAKVQVTDAAAAPAGSAPAPAPAASQRPLLRRHPPSPPAASPAPAAPRRRPPRPRQPPARAGGGCRSGGARRRPGRLHRGISRRRSGPEGDADRTLADAGRSVFERRLHPIEGATACRQGDRGCGGYGRLRHRIRAAANRP